MNMQSSNEFDIKDKLNNQKITVANNDDLKDIVRLNQQFHRDIKGFKWDKPEWINSEIQKGNYFVFKRGADIFGAIDIQKFDNEMYIEAIAVEPNQHRSGIGVKLIDFAKKIAQESNCKKLTVESFQSYNLLDFYQKIGFELDNPSVGYHEGQSFHRFVINL